MLGIGVGLFTLVSGVLPQITDWHNENDVHRVVFVDIPGPMQIMFYTVIPVMIIWGALHVRQPDEELGARRPVAAPHHTEERRRGASRTSVPAPTCRPCCATPAPASCTR